MDMNQMRVITTVLSFIVFLGVIAWAVFPKNKKGFDEAANLPFADDDSHLHNPSGDIK
ncbi:cbb3-type cytochrome c oxidase subunit 3 [Leeia sp. TBRC 13508]|uniref:Cbb3-type cytochrome c oxidase subunit 3 n=1 Tax=Leeia speluncae TaxID=2884804 RepID=A0ABS8D942_9NEIS|nr:cbb3-type cytochrome c oxidase subunit 3 [Leeia speluncae]MCB6184730.1 cbb3-type cytochrome c oxidase subunit 3 [Leeia speluncae]